MMMEVRTVIEQIKSSMEIFTNRIGHMGDRMSGSENKTEKLGHLVKVSVTTDTLFSCIPQVKSINWRRVRLFSMVLENRIASKHRRMTPDPYFSPWTKISSN